MAAASGSSLDVRALLAQSGKSSGRPSIEVEKEDDLTYDLGHLCAFDPSPLDDTALFADASAYLLAIARDNTQLLANRLYGLLATQPNKSVIKLPEPTTALPREKPLPKPKPQTRWEKFAAEKGITKKKRSKMVWDESAQRWAPRFGFGKANAQDDAPWLIPAKAGEAITYIPASPNANHAPSPTRPSLHLSREKRGCDSEAPSYHNLRATKFERTTLGNRFLLWPFAPRRRWLGRPVRAALGRQAGSALQAEAAGGAQPARGCACCRY